MKKPAKKKEAKLVSAPAGNPFPPVAAPQKAPTPEEIGRRAYEIYVQNGCADGHDMDHWLQAERDLSK